MTSKVIMTAGLAIGGCDDGGGGDEGPRTVDAAAVGQRALTYAERGFTRVTAEARKSQHQNANVHVWVADEAVAEYLKVQRGESSADPQFPEGTMIVKEQLDDGGGLQALTVMYKGPAGSGAASDDWFWERIEADATVSFSGQVQFCIDCHSPRREVDWVFGVEADNRAP